MKRIAVLGSTGSIGTQTLDVVARHPERFRIAALAGGTRTNLLAEQARRFSPALVSCAHEADAAQLHQTLSPHTRVEWGPAGLLSAAIDCDADLIVAATDGMVALEAICAAIERGIPIALANKELVVAAGELLLGAARASGSLILPVDSEHSALFQCVAGEPADCVAGLVLTASGGPFWRFTAAQMRTVTVADALRHPTWQMGTKNTVDSATMMNKGLEVIEAARLFGLPPERIHVLVHPTSLAHGFALLSDGSVKAQLAPPDMRIPIGYALAYPDRLSDVVPGDPLVALGAAPGAPSLSMTFDRPDFERFPALGLAYEALRRGGGVPATLSAANEIAVGAFVDGTIAFHEIAEVVATVMNVAGSEPLTLETLRATDARARSAARREVSARSAAVGANRPVPRAV